MSDLTMKIAEILQKGEVKQGFNLKFVQNIPKLYPQTPKIVFDDGEWNEDDHPRDENGMFTTGEGSNSGESTTVTVPRNYECRLAQRIGREQYDKIHDIIDKCPNEDLKDMWKKYEGEVGVGSINSAKQYCSGTNVYIDLKANDAGSEYKTPHESTFHEISHAMDNAGEYQSYELSNTIQKEYDDMINSMAKEMRKDFKEHAGDYEYFAKKGYVTESEVAGFRKTGRWSWRGEPRYSKKAVYEKIEEELFKIPFRERTAISDIFSGASMTKIKGGWGHKTKYWKKTSDHLGAEAFADITAAHFTNPKAVEHVKHYFPKSYEHYEKIINRKQ